MTILLLPFHFLYLTYRTEVKEEEGNWQSQISVPKAGNSEKVDRIFVGSPIKKSGTRIISRPQWKVPL